MIRGTLLMAGAIALGCSMQNREGLDLSCEELGNGLVNACRDGIITSCQDGAVRYRVCSDEDVCSAAWQQADAYRCSQTETLPSGGGASGTGGSSSGSGGTDGSATGGTNPGTGGDSSTDCASAACTIAEADQTIQSVALGADTVYFASCGEVASIPKGGGPRTILGVFAGSCGSGNVYVALGAGKVFVRRDNTVYSVPTSGGQLTEEAQEDFIGGIAADDAYLFWVGSSGINRQAHGESAEPISGSPAFAEALQVSNGYLYWATNAGFQRVPVAGSTVQSFSTSQEPRDLKVLGSNAYAPAGTAIVSVALPDGTETTLTLATDPDLIAANSTHVYWTERGGQPGIWTVPAMGGSSTRLHATAQSIGALEVDEDAVFWAEGTHLMSRTTD